MVGSSRRALFLVVFILVTCGFLGIVFGQKINPSAAPGGDSDVLMSTVRSIIERGQTRGEIRRDIDPETALELMASPSPTTIADCQLM